MKRIFHFCALIALMVFAASCIGPRGPQGPMGPAGKDGNTTYTKVVSIPVAQNNWVYSNADNNNYFYAKVNVPEITKYVFDWGIINMYRTWKVDGIDVKQQLPFVRHQEFYDESVGQWGFYTETVDYDYSVGELYIYYRASDFDYELNTTFVPDAMDFKMVIMYAD